MEAGSLPQNNMAYNGMKLYISTDLGDGSPDPVTSLDDPTPAHDNQHGVDANLGNFRDALYWQDILYFNSSNSAWDFSTVEVKGYPRLKGADGKPMAGQ